MIDRSIAVTLVLSALAVACGHPRPQTAPVSHPLSGSAVTAAPHRLHGEADDPAGDATADPRLARSPDLVHASVDVVDGQAHFVVRLVSGTFDRTTTLVIVNLDTDGNPSTGQAIAGLGVDYVISLGDGQGDTALIGRYGGSPATFVSVDRVPVVFMADGMDVSLPLALLGNPSGRMTFRVMTFIHVPNTQTTGVIDVLPDVNREPGRVE